MAAAAGTIMLGSDHQITPGLCTGEHQQLRNGEEKGGGGGGGAARHHLVGAEALKGPSAREDLVQHDAIRIHVGALGELSGKDDLRSHVGERARERVADVRRLGVEALAQAKVGDLCLHARDVGVGVEGLAHAQGQQDVERLEVAVDDPERMDMREAVGDVRRHRQRHERVRDGASLRVQLLLVQVGPQGAGAELLRWLARSGHLRTTSQETNKVTVHSSTIAAGNAGQTRPQAEQMLSLPG